MVIDAINDKLQSISSESDKVCPKCNGKIQRLIGGGGIVFKGSGFCVTDYKKNSNNVDSKNNTRSTKTESKTSI